jgi:hypothetical protein
MEGGERKGIKRERKEPERLEWKGIKVPHTMGVQGAETPDGVGKGCQQQWRP